MSENGGDGDMSEQMGMTYAPQGRPRPVCQPGDFIIAAVALDHDHIYAMCAALSEAGAQVKWVYDPSPEKVAAFCRHFPGARPARSEWEVLEDPEVKLVAGAAVPSERAGLGLRVMDHGKDYFTDKPPFTSLEQLALARAKVEATQRKYAVYYSGRIHVECAVFAGQLILSGAIGRVIQVLGLGPHRLHAANRPDWFFRRARYGGILCDLGSHQIEQFLYFGQVDDASITMSRAANYHHPEYPELEDFGEAALAASDGTAGYFRVDWFTPDGLGTWGDGRTFILGTEGYIELRPFIDVGRTAAGDQVYLVNGEKAVHIPVQGRVGYPFFGQLILDCLDRTEHAMTQSHAFKAAELSLIAQRDALRR
jgi:predicted dehydrogenase